MQDSVFIAGQRASYLPYTRICIRPKRTTRVSESGRGPIVRKQMSNVVANSRERRRSRLKRVRLSRVLGRTF